jgi:hypothetical protein
MIMFWTLYIVLGFSTRRYGNWISFFHPVTGDGWHRSMGRGEQEPKNAAVMDPVERGSRYALSCYSV